MPEKLILVGLAAHQGYLALPEVIAATCLRSFCGDQLFFYLGLKHSRAILARRPTWDAKIKRVHKMMSQFHTPMTPSFRFLYGLRTVVPFVIGMSTVLTKRFVLLNIVGAIVWALVVGIVVGIGGYAFGHALKIFIGKLEHYEVYVFVTIALSGILFWSVYFYRQRKRNS